MPDLNHGFSTGEADRRSTLDGLLRIASPVVHALAENKLRERLPVHPWEISRKDWTYSEAFARTLCGLAPWLELGPDETPEGRERSRFLDLTRKAIHNAFDDTAADFLPWDEGSQMLVEAAFFSHALLRAPNQLWSGLSETDRDRVLTGLRKTRAIQPHPNNWLLFSAMVEAALWKFSGDFRREPVEYALQTHMEWYLGDGTYGDGPELHWDYYNSYVIHPMLLDVLKVCRELGDPLGELLDLELVRAKRYANVLERMISPEATFPVIGRSSIYRCGAFQLLSQVILMRQLPESLDAGATRNALTSVIQRTLNAPGTFDEQGWMRFGAVGFQPEIREGYNSTGSLYLATSGLLHLGLPPDDPFWTASGGAWTQARIWASDDTIRADSALKETGENGRNRGL